ncbi:MAG: sigma-70 family RNA polymerase sigma factor [Christensenellaceae bacterium]|nr:sigma-70 family RNA polymerase sigma factor [Christensenellaceae bacterium]
MLEHTQTLEFIRQAKQGNETAKTTLITENSPLIKSVLKHYLYKGVDYDDLYQLGCMGFLKAINNFDESFNVKFSTYAVPMIAGEIKRFLRDDGSIKVSRAIKGQYYQMQKYIDSVKLAGGEPPSIQQLGEHFKMDEQDVIFTLEAARMPISLYGELNGKDGASGQTVMDKIVQDENSEQVLNRLILKDIIESLGPKDRKIIILRYFRDKTQSEVAKILNVSQVQVSRLENKILEKMKMKLK